MMSSIIVPVVKSGQDDYIYEPGLHCQQGATAVLALELGGREPHFTLVLGGEPLLTAASHTAPFHVLLLFLHAANTAHGARTPCMQCDCCPFPAAVQSARGLVFQYQHGG